MNGEDFDQLIFSVKAYLDVFFKEKLSREFYFHNALHTNYVVAATREIGAKSGLNEEQLQTVILAAYFHDTGYVETYKRHELVSIEIATMFLAQFSIDKYMIDDLRQCILATRYPQEPCNLMEMVVCDADFYHLACSDYTIFERDLRLEWTKKLNLVYSDKDWNNINLEMLTNHQYFTKYGQEVLQPLKNKNMQRIDNALHMN